MDDVRYGNRIYRNSRHPGTLVVMEDEPNGVGGSQHAAPQPASIGGQLLARPRLVTRLRDGLSGGVTMVCAPAGYGKSVLLAQWLVQHEGLPVMWVSLRPGDDARRVASRLVGSLSALGAESPDAIALLGLRDGGSTLGAPFLDAFVR